MTELSTSSQQMKQSLLHFQITEDEFTQKLSQINSTRAKVNSELIALTQDYDRKLKELQLRLDHANSRNDKLSKENHLYRKEIQAFQSRLIEKQKLIATLLTQGSDVTRKDYEERAAEKAKIRDEPKLDRILPPNFDQSAKKQKNGEQSQKLQKQVKVEVEVKVKEERQQKEQPLKDDRIEIAQTQQETVTTQNKQRKVKPLPGRKNIAGMNKPKVQPLQAGFHSLQVQEAGEYQTINAEKVQDNMDSANFFENLANEEDGQEREPKSASTPSDEKNQELIPEEEQEQGQLPQQAQDQMQMEYEGQIGMGEEDQAEICQEKHIEMEYDKMGYDDKVQNSENFFEQLKDEEQDQSFDEKVIAIEPVKPIKKEQAKPVKSTPPPPPPKKQGKSKTDRKQNNDQPFFMDQPCSQDFFSTLNNNPMADAQESSIDYTDSNSVISNSAAKMLDSGYSEPAGVAGVKKMPKKKEKREFKSIDPQAF